jgi:hypothetical protein
MIGVMMMSDVIQEQSVSNDDIEQQSEFDAILLEAVSVDGGEVGENGLIEDSTNNEPEMQTSEILFPIIAMGFDIVVPQWKVRKEEKQALAEAYGALLDKYFPDAGNYFGVEITALMATGMICMPRVLADKKEKEVNPQEKPKQAKKADFSSVNSFDVKEINLD